MSTCSTVQPVSSASGPTGPVRGSSPLRPNRHLPGPPAAYAAPLTEQDRTRRHGTVGRRSDAAAAKDGLIGAAGDPGGPPNPRGSAGAAGQGVLGAAGDPGGLPNPRGSAGAAGQGVIGAAGDPGGPRTPGISRGGGPRRA